MKTKREPTDLNPREADDVAIGLYMLADHNQQIADDIGPCDQRTRLCDRVERLRELAKTISPNVARARGTYRIVKRKDNL